MATVDVKGLKKTVTAFKLTCHSTTEQVGGGEWADS